MLKTNNIIHMFCHIYTFVLAESDSSSAMCQWITRLREQYRGTVHLFIGTGRSMCIITNMPFTINYNNDTEHHGF